jgi:hypothetical protein
VRIDPDTCRDADLLAAEVRRLQSVIAASEPEIAHLRLAIARLADQDATLSICNGNVTVTLDATLTDAERDAIDRAACAFEYDDDNLACAELAETLRGLLERLA